ncbi:hypothetical protein SAY86_001133 [Trapa natans]|uniref:Uncharacterized protein n=1 Tax=Trapa natans TaxID=22666 RepID=A0AAN7MVK2_TRANT|nr:hypothetical protein SAY86_001133 [Trapa natans]
MTNGRGDISLGNLMLRMFTQFHKFMEVEYLPVVFPLENQKEISTHFGKRTRLALSRSLNVAQTSHSYGDIMLLTKASESEQLFHVKSLEAIDFLDKFLSMSPDSSGLVTLNGFLSALRLKDSNLGNEIFQFIDTENNGCISFKQQPLFKADCEQAFLDCDSGGNDHVSAEQFGECIRPAIPEMMKDEVLRLSLQTTCKNGGNKKKMIDLSKPSMSLEYYILFKVALNVWPERGGRKELAFTAFIYYMHHLDRKFSNLNQTPCNPNHPNTSHAGEMFFFGQIKELFGLFDVAGNGKPDKEESLSCLKQNPLLIALFSSHLGHARTPEATADDIV